jgi:hypothetical protein
MAAFVGPSKRARGRTLPVPLGAQHLKATLAGRARRCPHGEVPRVCQACERREHAIGKMRRRNAALLRAKGLAPARRKRGRPRRRIRLYS